MLLVVVLAATTVLTLGLDLHSVTSRTSRPATRRPGPT